MNRLKMMKNLIIMKNLIVFYAIFVIITTIIIRPNNQLDILSRQHFLELVGSYLVHFQPSFNDMSFVHDVANDAQSIL